VGIETNFIYSRYVVLDDGLVEVDILSSEPNHFMNASVP
jgi:hypothetical protein